MNVTEAMQIARRAILGNYPTWPGYSPREIPLAIFDAQDAAYLNHPNPPQGRPEGLTAATVVEINGHLTATIPLWVCAEPRAVGPLVYHECFHVYQQRGGFQPHPLEASLDFFAALADYPELDPLYRALCRAEAEVLNHPNLAPVERAGRLATLAWRRYAILESLPGPLALEQVSERREGTAYFVQQTVDYLLNGNPPPVAPATAGYARLYHVGAAVCRLLDQLETGWQKEIEAGLSPTQALIQRFVEERPSLADLDLGRKVNEEHAAVAATLEAIEAEFSQERIEIEIPPQGAQRTFNPMTVLSLGDGRVLHREVYSLALPNGKLQLRSGKVLEDYRAHKISLPAAGVQFGQGRLWAKNDLLEMEFEQVEQSGENAYRLGGGGLT